MPRSSIASRILRAPASLVPNRTAALGATIVVLAGLAAVLAPWLTDYDPDAQVLAERLQPPSTVHWLGTDQLGRDLLTRLLHGSRSTLLIVAAAAATVAPVGLAIGILAGWFGGWVDAVLMRVTDIFMAFPRLILALALAAVLGPGIENAVVAIAVTAWPPYARLCRAETLSLRKREFVLAARLQGASMPRLLGVYVLPFCVSTVLARLTLDLAGMILVAAGLGFLGLGVKPPTPEWGSMVAAGRDFIADQWWLTAIPGAAIFIVSLGFNLIGDGVRDAMDPRTHREPE